MAQHVVSGAAGVIGGNTNIDVDAALSSMQAGLDAMEIPELLLLVMETSLVSLCMKIMSVLITVILYGRMIEIYLYCSVSPIPFATMTNREWGQIGNNYIKALFALGFQGCKGENRAVQVVRYNHAANQNRINADAYHYEEALKTERRRFSLGVCTRTQRLIKNQNESRF